MVLCMCVIFCFSAQPRESSASTSGVFSEAAVEIWEGVFGCESEERHGQNLSAASFFVRKAAHIALYALLGASAFFAIYTRRLSAFANAAVAFAISLLYAISDEVHQTFVPGRAGMAADVFVDCIGIAAATVLCALAVRFFEKRRTGEGAKNRKIQG